MPIFMQVLSKETKYAFPIYSVQIKFYINKKKVLLLHLSAQFQ